MRVFVWASVFYGKLQSQVGASQRDGEHWEAEGIQLPALVVFFPQWPTLEAVCIVVMQSSLS